MDLDLLRLIVNGGPWAVIVWLFVTHRLVPGWVYDQVNAERGRLLKTYEEQVIPALIEAVRLAAAKEPS
jgi:hypothetical protein